jgi:predicted dehydrogenase
MSEQRIQVGVVGAGGIARRRHLPGFAAIDGVEVVVVCNRTEASSRRVADEFGIPRVAERWQDVVADSQVDAVLVAAWPYLHADVTCAALEAGKHVLCEARMARNGAEAQRMLVASHQRPGLVCQIVPAPFSMETDDVLRELFASGELGELREINVLWLTGDGANEDAPMHWRYDREISGHNIMALGILHETVQRWTELEPTWVAADAETFVTLRRDEWGGLCDVGIPDSLTVVGRYPSGARMLYALSGVQSGRPVTELRLNGSRSCLRFDAASEKLFRTPVGGEERPVDIPPSKRRGWRVERDFIDSIRTGAPVRLTSFEQGARYMRFIDAVWESMAEDGRRVTV